MNEELKQLIYQAWCDNHGVGIKNTFGNFLDRAAEAIIQAGWNPHDDNKELLLSDAKIMAEAIIRHDERRWIGEWFGEFREMRVKFPLTLNNLKSGKRPEKREEI